MKEYKTNDLIIYWYPENCSHSGKCTKLLPKVFDFEKRPWVNPDGASAEEIIELIDKCPSGALRYKLTENSRIDPEIAKGPLLVRGAAKIIDPDGKILRECESMVLCRCGKTKNPPFCDGSHTKEE